MQIIACRDQDDIWRKGFHCSRKVIFIDIQQLPVSAVRHDRMVGSGTLSLAYATISFGTSTGIGKGLMRREVKNCTISIKSILRTITVMHIKINDHHFFVADILGILGCNSDVVKKTKAHSLFWCGVVTRRPYRTKSPIKSARPDTVKRCHSCPYGFRCCTIRLTAAHRISIDRGSHIRGFLDQGNVCRGMYQAKYLYRNRDWFDTDQLWQKRFYCMVNRHKPLSRLRMSCASIMLQIDLVCDIRYFHTSIIAD